MKIFLDGSFDISVFLYLICISVKKCNFILSDCVNLESTFIAKDVVLRAAMHEDDGNRGKYCYFGTKGMTNNNRLYSIQLCF